MMKGWTKRRIALILALALIAAQMTGCKKKEADAQNAIANENAVIVETTEVPAQEEMESADAVAWLEENLENIHQSLLSGEYAQVVDLLLGMQDQLRDNAEYNALLYIAYMGNGNESDAAELLKNPNLNTNDFTDAFLENADSLKDNADIAAIERALMEHMLALGETNPQAYESVARIGVNIYNSNPSDPTAYAARYLAALAAGDEEAAKAILAEAEANGVSAESLQTTAIAFIEEYNLTAVSVEEIQKGKNTSTTYNSSGDVVKSEVTVDNNDGTETKYVKNSDGTVIGEALYDKATGHLITRTFYNVNRVRDPNTGEITETLTGTKEVYEYENGVVKSITSYLADDSTNYRITLTADGQTASVYDYTTGTERPWTQEMLDALEVVVQNGDVVSMTTPQIDSDRNVTGKTEVKYDYTNPVGLVSGWSKYENGYFGYVKLEEAALGYTFENNAKADYKMFHLIEYSFGNKDMEFSYDYEDGKVTKSSTIQYDTFTGEINKSMVTDWVNHTSQMYENGLLFDAVTDESNRYILTQNIYYGNSTSGQLYARTFNYYEGGKQIGELDVYYDADGRVTKEATYGHEGVVIPGKPSKVVQYSYTDGVKTRIEADYDTQGKIITQSASKEHYGPDGKVEKVVYYVAGTDRFEPDKTEKFVYDENGRLITKQLTDNDGNVVKETDYTYENGITTVTTVDGAGDVISKVQTSYIYGEKGEVTSETVYQVGQDDTKEEVSVKDYTYDDSGTMTGYIISVKDENGNIQKTHYTAEGYPYEVAIYDTSGQLLMVMRLDENAPDEVEEVEDETVTDPTEGEDTVTDPTEGEDTVTDPTEGEDTVTDPTEGEDTVTDPTEGEDTVTDPTEGEDTVTDPTEGEDTVTDPTEGEDTVTDPTEGENTVTDLTEGEDTVTGSATE